MSIVFEEDIFDVKDVDKDGKFFERVSRIHCSSENYETDLVLDVATEVYPIEVGDKFSLALATTINLDGSPDSGVFDQSGKPTLADRYQYVMYGKVFKYEEDRGSNMPKLSVYASFGGLLMSLKGDPRNLQGIQRDSRIYLLMRKV